MLVGHEHIQQHRLTGLYGYICLSSFASKCQPFLVQKIIRTHQNTLASLVAEGKGLRVHHRDSDGKQEVQLAAQLLDLVLGRVVRSTITLLETFIIIIRFLRLQLMYAAS